MHVSADHLLAAARERFALQDYYGAVHLLEELVAAGGAYADAHHLLGLSLSLLGQSERALEAFDTALTLNPRYIEALIHRGVVLNELGRGDEAEAAFRRAQAAAGPSVGGFPAHVAARLANHHAALGEMYAEAAALPEAIAQYRRALELGPAYHDLRYRLARLLLESGNALEARVELERVLAERPNFVDAEAALGLAHYLSGDALAARDVWRACLARRPENARVEAYLSMLERAAR
jgi:tetratricopeptide (TPR) repeat protein